MTDETNEILGMINKAYAKATDSVNKINLERAGNAAVEILGEVTKLIQNGKADKAIARSIMFGGDIAKSIAKEAITAHGEIMNAAFNAMDRITAVLADEYNEEAADLIKGEWVRVALANPLSAIKLRKSFNELKCSLGLVDEKGERADMIMDAVREVADEIIEEQEADNAIATEMFEEFKRTGGTLDDLIVEDGRIVFNLRKEVKDINEETYPSEEEKLETSHAVPSDKRPHSHKAKKVVKPTMKKAAKKSATRSGRK